MGAGRARVTFIPLGDRIGYRVAGTIVCERDGLELPGAGTYAKDDLIWLAVFGSRRAVARFLRRGAAISSVVSLLDLGYDPCDRRR
ncbi:MAG TPA: hypothetical protein VGE07_12315 [Herpetosiphonaceae bacterium]